MEKLTKKRMLIQLHIAGNPTILLLTVLPEHIVNLSQIDSGGTNVTVAQPLGGTSTIPVIEEIDHIKYAIKECKQVDGL
jgi:hypothetical protein